jgi:hypothetical protein
VKLISSTHPAFEKEIPKIIHGPKKVEIRIIKI